MSDDNIHRPPKDQSEEWPELKALLNQFREHELKTAQERIKLFSERARALNRSTLTLQEQLELLREAKALAGAKPAVSERATKAPWHGMPLLVRATGRLVASWAIELLASPSLMLQEGTDLRGIVSSVVDSDDGTWVVERFKWNAQSGKLTLELGLPEAEAHKTINWHLAVGITRGAGRMPIAARFHQYADGTVDPSLITVDLSSDQRDALRSGRLEVRLVRGEATDHMTIELEFMAP